MQDKSCYSKKLSVYMGLIILLSITVPGQYRYIRVLLLSMIQPIMPSLFNMDSDGFVI